MYEIENIKKAIINAPVKVLKNEEIIGFWIKRADGLYWICNNCMSRLMTRGIKIDDTEIVWKDDKSKIKGACICCE